MSLFESRVLVVDDDEKLLFATRLNLEMFFSNVFVASNEKEAIKIIETEGINVAIVDMNLTPGATTGRDGLRLLSLIKEKSQNTQVIVNTAFGAIDLAVKAMKDGASDFITKPWNPGKVHLAIKVAHENSLNEQGISPKKNDLTTQQSFKYQSSEMQTLMGMVSRVALTDANVLLLGENGTGKDLIAKEIHLNSKRKDKPFIKIDLGAIQETIFESELFGHVKGAFTDAIETRTGWMEAASGGTLFLDEIGNLPLSLQSKLLTVLQNRQISKVGSREITPIDIRLICATNMPLYEMIKEERFRTDLFYRIKTVEIQIPPLRERSGDIMLLSDHFATVYSKKYQLENKQFTKETRAILENYSWPGNIRELQNCIENAVIMSKNKEITPEDLNLGIHQITSSNSNIQVDSLNIEEIEKDAIKRAIDKHKGNLSLAAKELGIGRATLYRKIEKYAL